MGKSRTPVELYTAWARAVPEPHMPSSPRPFTPRSCWRERMLGLMPVPPKLQQRLVGIGLQAIVVSCSVAGKLRDDWLALAQYRVSWMASNSMRPDCDATVNTALSTGEALLPQTAGPADMHKVLRQLTRGRMRGS